MGDCTLSGIVATDRNTFDHFMTSVGEHGVDLGEYSRGNIRVGFAVNPSGDCAFASDDDLAVAISFLPPLASLEKGEKVEATLRGFRSSADPIENARDQCSVAVWSSGRQELSLYRDWRGSPPLYYSETSKGFMWSTSIRALLRLGVERTEDHIALAQLQQVGYVPSPRTLVNGISKVPAGHMLSFRNEKIQIKRHWRPQFHPKHHDGVRKRATRIKEILARSIADMAPRTGPTGVLLSGGIDSVVVATTAVRVVGLDLEAYTFRYRDYSGPYNEGPAAQAVADRLGINHTEIGIGPDFVMDHLPNLIAAYEEPMTYGLHSARMEPLKQAGVDVALSGVDAPFFNVPPALSWALRIDKALPHKLLNLGRLVTAGAAGGPVHRANTLLTTATQTPAERYMAFPLHRLIADELRQTIYSDPGLATMADTDLATRLAHTLDEVGDLSARDQLIVLGVTGSAPEHVLAWNHRWGSAAGVSVRLPLCDDEFVDYMSRRPMASSSKEDLRMVAAEYLPTELANTPKIPQTVPIKEWFRDAMKDYVRDHLDRRTVTDDGTFDPDVVDRCLREHMAGQANHKWVLWTCLTYLIWRDEVLHGS